MLEIVEKTAAENRHTFRKETQKDQKSFGLEIKIFLD
jgi:hypothetical protein